MALSEPESAAEVAQLAFRLRRLVMQRQDAWLDLDLTMPQLRALTVVRRRQPVTVSELAGELDQRLAAVSALVNRLVRAGLVTRAEDPDDRRRIRLGLSEDAERMLAGIDERAAARFTEVLGRMSPQGRRSLAAALDELVEILSASQQSQGG